MLIHLTGSFGEDPIKLTLIVGPKTRGQVYWKARDICRILKLSKLPQMRRSVSRNTKRYWDVSEKYQRSNTYVLSTDDIYQLFEELSPRARNRDFETWFANLNSGTTKLISQKHPKLFHQSLKRIAEEAIIDSSVKSNSRFRSPHYLSFPLLGEYQRLYVNEYVHIPTCIKSESGLSVETEESKAMQTYAFTLPDLVDIIKRIPVVNRNNEAVDQFKRFYKETVEDVPTPSSDHSDSFMQQTDTIQVKPDEMMSIVRPEQSFPFHDRLSDKHYKFVALDLNWQLDTIRPMHTFPFVMHHVELKRNLLYVPVEVDDGQE